MEMCGGYTIPSQEAHCGSFLLGDLPSGDLVERQRQIESVYALGFQRQFAHVLVAMHRHEFARLVIHDCHW